MKTACIILADGFEEVEAITPIDYLRRAGIKVCIAGLSGKTVVGGHAVTIIADCLLAEIKDQVFDVLVLPGGGKGAENIAASSLALELVHAHYKAGRYIAAICAAPALVLGKAAQLLNSRRFTCYPGMEKEVPGGTYNAQPTTVDGTLITGAGPACAQAFALAIIEEVLDSETARQLKTAILA